MVRSPALTGAQADTVRPAMVVVITPPGWSIEAPRVRTVLPSAISVSPISEYFRSPTGRGSHSVAGAMPMMSPAPARLTTTTMSPSLDKPAVSPEAMSEEAVSVAAMMRGSASLAASASVRMRSMSSEASAVRSREAPVRALTSMALRTRRARWVSRSAMISVVRSCSLRAAALDWLRSSKAFSPSARACRPSRPISSLRTWPGPLVLTASVSSPCWLRFAKPNRLHSSIEEAQCLGDSHCRGKLAVWLMSQSLLLTKRAGDDVAGIA